MTRNIQLHTLSAHGPANMVRDDQNRPKTAIMGNVPRLRLSSQAKKRSYRTSTAFQAALEGKLGERTARLGEVIEQHLASLGADKQKAFDIACEIAAVFGKVGGASETPSAEDGDLDEEVVEAKAKAGKKPKKEKEKTSRTAQLAFISPVERDKALELAEKALKGEKLPTGKDLEKMVLQKADTAVDIAMFGRMLAASPDYNREAAVQVSHAVTTHRAVVEDDFYTAVDDRKTAAEDSGAGFIGEAGFGSGLFYTYINIDLDLLEKNLDGDKELAARAVDALIEAVATTTPGGKRASFAHHGYANYIRAEFGTAQPRSLVGAFYAPVADTKDLIGASVEKLESHAKRIDTAYGQHPEVSVMDVEAEIGSLQGIRDFAAKVMAA